MNKKLTKLYEELEEEGITVDKHSDDVSERDLSEKATDIDIGSKPEFEGLMPSKSPSFFSGSPLMDARGISFKRTRSTAKFNAMDCAIDAISIFNEKNNSNNNGYYNYLTSSFKNPKYRAELDKAIADCTPEQVEVLRKINNEYAGCYADVFDKENSEGIRENTKAIRTNMKVISLFWQAKGTMPGNVRADYDYFEKLWDMLPDSFKVPSSHLTQTLYLGVDKLESYFGGSFRKANPTMKQYLMLGFGPKLVSVVLTNVYNDKAKPYGFMEVNTFSKDAPVCYKADVKNNIVYPFIDPATGAVMTYGKLLELRRLCNIIANRDVIVDYSAPSSRCKEKVFGTAIESDMTNESANAFAYLTALAICNKVFDENSRNSAYERMSLGAVKDAKSDPMQLLRNTFFMGGSSEPGAVLSFLTNTKASSQFDFEDGSMLTEARVSIKDKDAGKQLIDGVTKRQAPSVNKFTRDDNGNVVFKQFQFNGKMKPEDFGLPSDLTAFVYGQDLVDSGVVRENLTGMEFLRIACYNMSTPGIMSANDAEFIKGGNVTAAGESNVLVKGVIELTSATAFIDASASSTRALGGSRIETTDDEGNTTSLIDQARDTSATAEENMVSSVFNSVYVPSELFKQDFNAMFSDANKFIPNLITEFLNNAGGPLSVVINRNLPPDEAPVDKLQGAAIATGREDSDDGVTPRQHDDRVTPLKWLISVLKYYDIDGNSIDNQRATLTIPNIIHNGTHTGYTPEDFGKEDATEKVAGDDVYRIPISFQSRHGHSAPHKDVYSTGALFGSKGNGKIGGNSFGAALCNALRKLSANPEYFGKISDGQGETGKYYGSAIRLFTYLLNYTSERVSNNGYTRHKEGALPREMIDARNKLIFAIHQNALSLIKLDTENAQKEYADWWNAVSSNEAPFDFSRHITLADPINARNNGMQGSAYATLHSIAGDNDSLAIDQSGTAFFESLLSGLNRFLEDAMDMADEDILDPEWLLKQAFESLTQDM